MDNVQSIFEIAAIAVYGLSAYLNLVAFYTVAVSKRPRILKLIVSYISILAMILSVVYVVLSLDWLLGERASDLDYDVNWAWLLYETLQGIFMGMVGVGVYTYLTWPVKYIVINSRDEIDRNEPGDVIEVPDRRLEKREE